MASKKSPLTALSLEVARLAHRVQADGPRTLGKVVVVCGFLVSWKWAGALGIPLILYGIYRLARELMWARARRKVLAESNFPAPSLLGSMNAHRVEWSRIRKVRKQWEIACGTAKLTSGAEKVPPTLLKLRSTVDLDILARIKPGEMGIPVEKILKHSRAIAETIGCRELVVTQTTIGCADLTFLWSETMERVLEVADVPRGPKGTIAFGIHRDMSAAAIPAGLPCLVSGMTGSGKSGVTWSLMGDLNRQYWQDGQRFKYDLYASDPKGGVELGILADKVGRGRMGPLEVKGYATDVQETADMIIELEKVMKARQAEQHFRKWTIDDAYRFPMILFVIDESVEVMKNLKPEHQTKLLTIISQIRASGGMVLALTQMAQKDVLGQLRDMFPTRLSLAQRNKINTDMALGDGAEDAGARCSTIVNQPGMGFSYDETRRGYELFRAGWCSDAAIARIAEGLAPVGMEARESARIPKRVAVYRVYDRHGRLLYVGISDAPGRRLNSEHSNPAHKDFKSWWHEVDPSQTLVVYKKDEATARAAEEEAIRDELPLYNDQHNRDNPLRVDWRAGFRAPDVTLEEKHSRNPFRRQPKPVQLPVEDLDAELEELVASSPAFPPYEPPVEVPATDAPATGPEETSVPDPEHLEEPHVPDPETPSSPAPGGRYKVRRQASPETLERARLRREARLQEAGSREG